MAVFYFMSQLPYIDHIIWIISKLKIYCMRFTKLHHISKEVSQLKNNNGADKNYTNKMWSFEENFSVCERHRNVYRLKKRVRL